MSKEKVDSLVVLEPPLIGIYSKDKTWWNIYRIVDIEADDDTLVLKANREEVKHETIAKVRVLKQKEETK